jgi:hypothetical protein
MGTIVLGNGSGARAAAPSGINRYNVTLTGPSGQTMSQDITGLSGTFKVTPGEWELVITGYDGSAIASKAVKTVTVKAGKNTPADIRMGLYHEARTAGDFDGTVLGNTSIYPTSYAHWIEVIGTITFPGSDYIIVPSSLATLTISSDGSGVLATTSTFETLNIAVASTVTLRNITLQNSGTGIATSVVNITTTNATLILERGARLTKTVTAANAIRVQSGKLKMYAGSEISGGTSGGVYIFGNGTFTMYGGSIHDSIAASGGGVYVFGGTFTMHGGSIHNNYASTSGGGVFVDTSSTFTKYGGTVYGSNGGSMANTSPLGAAAYYVSGTVAIEDTF